MSNGSADDVSSSQSLTEFKQELLATLIGRGQQMSLVTMCNQVIFSHCTAVVITLLPLEA